MNIGYLFLTGVVIFLLVKRRKLYIEKKPKQLKYYLSKKDRDVYNVIKRDKELSIITKAKRKRKNKKGSVCQYQSLNENQLYYYNTFMEKSISKYLNIL